MNVLMMVLIGFLWMFYFMFIIFLNLFLLKKKQFKFHFRINIDLRNLSKWEIFLYLLYCLYEFSILFVIWVLYWGILKINNMLLFLL